MSIQNDEVCPHSAPLLRPGTLRRALHEEAPFSADDLDAAYCEELDPADVFLADGRLRRTVAGPLLPLLLRYTNVRALLGAEQLAAAAAAAQSIEALDSLRPAELVRVAERLRTEQHISPEFRAAVLERLGSRTRIPAQRMSIPADPLSERSVRTHWKFAVSGASEAELLLYTGTDTDILIPPRVGARVVTKISPEAFRTVPQLSSAQLVARRSIARVRFPGTIHTVPAGLFADCADSLAHADVAEGVRRIDENAFRGCALRSIHLPGSVTAVGARAFAECTRLEDVTLPAGIETICEQTFAGCTSLHALPDMHSVQHVCSGAFRGAGLERVALYPNGPTFDDFVFAGCERLRRVTMEEGTAYVPRGSFADCHSLSDVQIAFTVRTIAPEAFARCPSLEQLRLPSGIERIGDRAFCDCWALSDIEIPDTVRIVGSGAFGGCAALRRIRLAGVECLGARAFASCRQLADVVLPERLELIPEEAFSECTSLRFFELPAGVKCIEEHAFSRSGLCTVRIPPQIGEVKTGAFSGCESLESVELQGDPKLHPALFRGCPNLARVAMPQAREISWEMFRDCLALRTFRIPVDAKQIGTGAFSGSGLEQITIPAGVHEIREGAFAHCTSLRSVCFETGEDGRIGVQEIPSRLFAACGALRSIVIPEGVREIRDAAFQGAGIERIVLPSTLEQIHAKAFCGCSNLREVIFADAPDHEERPLQIGACAFQDCSMLREIRLPDRLTVLGQSAFANSGILSAVLPKKLTRAGKNAFRGARRLKEVRIEAGGADIVPSGTFRDCTNLERVVIGGDVRSIGARAFQRTGLKELVIPVGVREIGSSAFRSCSALTSVRFDGTPHLGTDLFRACHHLTAAELPELLSVIPARMFRNCSRLRKIAFPPHLKEVGERAFQSTGLVEACLPRSVRRIGEGAFFGCRRLENVTVPENAEVGQGAFLRCPGLADENGTIVVSGTVYGTGKERSFAYVNSRGHICPPQQAASDADAPAVLQLPDSAKQIDPLLMLPEIVYRSSTDEPPAQVLPHTLRTGDLIAFGRFPQTVDFRQQPIEWVVLDGTREDVQLAAARPLFFVHGAGSAARADEVLHDAFVRSAFTPGECAGLRISPSLVSRLSDTDAAACGLRADPTDYARKIAKQYACGLDALQADGIFVRPVVRILKRYWEERMQP